MHLEACFSHMNLYWKKLNPSILPHKCEDFMCVKVCLCLCDCVSEVLSPHIEQ